MIADDRRIAEAATPGKWQQGALGDGDRTVWAADGCVLGWVPVGRHVADAAHIANMTPARVLRYVALAEAAQRVDELAHREDSHGYAAWLQATGDVRAALAALDAPDEKDPA